MSGRSTLAVLSLAVVLAGAAAPGPSPDNNPAWFEPVDPLRIVGPIWYVGTRDLGVYLITTPHGHILIDGAMPQSAGLIEASIRKAGFKPEEIRLLLITHAHVDHVGTLAHFKKRSGAKLAVMAPDDELLRSGGKSDYLYAKAKKMHFPKVTADEALKDGDTVTLGDVTLTARRTPGHTRGGTTWVMTADDGGRSYSVVFPCSTSINPGTRLVKEPSYPGIADDYRRALDVLGDFQPDIWLPAHVSFFDLEGKRQRAATEGAQAFVDPGGYRRRLADQQKNFEALVAKETLPTDGSAAIPGGTSWRLVRFQGGDDTTLTPDDPAKYTLAIATDGTLSASLDCNRGHGTWTSSGPGQIQFGPMAITRALCPPGSMHDRIVKDWGFVRSYVLRNGHLFLSLMADGGIYEFEPA